MSTLTNPIKSYDDALNFLPRADHKGPRRGAMATLRLLFDSLREGLAAERRYFELTNHGVAPSEAATRVFSEHFDR